MKNTKIFTYACAHYGSLHRTDRIVNKTDHMVDNVLQDA